MFGHDGNQDNQNQHDQPVVDQPMDNGVMPDPINGSPAAPVSDQPATDNVDDTAGAPMPPAPVTDDYSSDKDILPAAPSEDLINMKQEALQHLTPLVGHLDQSPEEKFRTLMMMIQASDDHTKLKEAFETAKQITDDKARAQALLDVINEINYFTQQSAS